MIYVLNESPDSIELFNSFIEYAKNHKSKFLYIKPSSISFKKNNGTYQVSNEGNKIMSYLDGDSIGKLTSLDEFINLINTGDIK